jgi:membrane protein implicated in regulation of membrane protease activity
MASLYLWLFVITGGFLAISVILHPIVTAVDRLFHGVNGFLDGLLHIHHVANIGAGHSLGHGGGEYQQIGRVNSRSLLAFIAFFGGVGRLMLELRLPGLLAFLIALAAGFFSAWAIWKLICFVASQGGSSHITSLDPIGRIGNVSVAIPTGGFGLIQLNVRGETIRVIASSVDSQAIPAGTEVAVVKNGAKGAYIVQPNT